MARIVILGAGLTGLSTAYHLEQENVFDFKIFEKNKTVGGLCRSVKHEGFTFDYTGHFIHIGDPYFKSFLEDITSLENFHQIARKSFIYSHETFVTYPFQINLHGLPREVITDCIEGFVNRTASRRAPKTFPQWVLKHFGQGIAKHFFFPYNSKILATDLKKIVPSWTGRFVPKTSLRMMIEGALAPRNDVGYNSIFYYPKDGGIEYFPTQIAAALQSNVHTDHEAKVIDLKQRVVQFTNGHREPFDVLVSTLPLDTMLLITKERSRHALTKAASKLLCNSVVNFNLGLDVADIGNKHWIYFPEKKYAFYRMGFWNNVSPSLTRKDHSALYGEIAYIPGTKSRRNIEALTKKSIAQTLNFLGLSSDNVVAEKILHLGHAYVLYDAWREKYLTKLHQSLREEGILSVGRFGEWKYSSMQEAILDGRDTARTALQTQQKRFHGAQRTELDLPTPKPAKQSPGKKEKVL